MANALFLSTAWSLLALVTANWLAILSAIHDLIFGTKAVPGKYAHCFSAPPRNQDMDRNSRSGTTTGTCWPVYRQEQVHVLYLKY